MVFEEVEVTVSGVTVKGPNNETGSMTVNSGVLGHKTIQLVSDVIYSEGQGDESVIWSSSSANNTVSSTGLVNITANENTTITATSAEDDSAEPASASITLNISGLENPTFIEPKYDVNTTNFGSTQIVTSANNTPVTQDVGNIRFTYTRISGSSNPGYYTSSPVSVRAYANTTLKIQLIDGSLMHFIKLKSLNAGNKISASAVTLSTGTFVTDGEGENEINLHDSPADSVTLTASAQFRFDRIEIYYLETDQVKADRFVNTYMHLDDDDYDKGATYVGLCDADDGEGNTPYTLARDAFNALDPSTRQYFVDNSGSGKRYEAAYARLVAWATANGESLNGSNQFAVAAARMPGAIANLSQEYSATTVIIIISVVGIVAIGGYFVFRRRKEY